MTAAARCAALALVAGMAACGRAEPEGELRARVAAMAQAVEARRVGDAVEVLAEDFTRDSGAFGKADARRVLAGALLRNEQVRVVATVSDVRIDGDRATAKVRVLAAGGDGLLPDRGRSWDFDTAWRRERGKWLLYNAEWRDG